ncbi:MAG: sulfatase-like hydrolase/transferase [Candidatus Lokiarchaeota archaeon]|nr:sulfatase-like hydrolase/transferase [Candidatus Lokiarchaeota archaeon]
MSEKYNVLFIISDQHRADHLSCAGNEVLKTPNLDKLASQGVRFTNAFCTNPMCMPNRATLLTGLYPNAHGVRSNGMIMSRDIPTITDTLVDKGWHTAAFGKLHHQFNTPPYRIEDKSAESFHDWVFPKKGEYPVRENFPIPYYGYQEVETVIGHGPCLTGHYMNWLEERSSELAESMRERWDDIDNFFSVFCEHDLPTDLYSTKYVEERTIAFLERHARGEYGDKPFYVHCSFPDPHQPVCPPGKYRELYNPDDVSLPDNFDDIENLHKHPFLAPYLNVFPGAMLRETNEKEVKQFIAWTYGTIALIDHSIGQILASLDKLGYADNTIVIYTSDHGDLMGEHGLLFKGPAPFEGVFNIPLIFRAPEIKTNVTTDALIASIDLPKTILSMLDIRERYHPPDIQGKDYTEVLRNPSKEVKDSILIENDEEVGPKGPLYVRLRHLITKHYKLTVYEDKDKNLEDYGDLFNRKEDPEELNNLWFKDDIESLKLRLVNKMLHKSLQAQSRFPKRIAGT